MERNARALLTLLPLLLTASACIVDLGKLGEEDTEGTDDGGTSGMVDPTGESGDGDSGGSDGMDVPVPTERAVDILFVIDNSGSMGEEQAKLADAIDVLAIALDVAPIPVDYRIGVTTTDNGNPWCGTTSPEGGALRATSCRSRPEEFTFNGAVAIEAFDTACAALCPAELDSLGIQDGAPWIEVNGSLGTSNVSGSVADNLRCMLPQGIDGCGFEQPLESMWKALDRFEDPMDPSFGFHRPGALLAVMFISDEVDCSYNSAWDSMFLPEGNRVFWSDNEAASPTSAVCWNAAMACHDDGAGGIDCATEDYDIDGNPGASPNDAVLHPIGRYTSALLGEGAFVSAIYGVGLDGSVTYETPPDYQFQLDYGIGPGCESASGTAVPPARTREVVTILGGGHASICADGYEQALTVFGQGILARLP